MPDQHAMVVARLHAQIHQTGEGCCCPARDVVCAGCPQHKYSSIPNVDALKARLAELEAQQPPIQRLIEAARLVVIDAGIKPGSRTRVGYTVGGDGIAMLAAALNDLGALPEATER